MSRARGDDYGHGAAPVVDVQSIIQQRVISREERDAIPLPSNSGAYVAIIPGAGKPPQTRTSRNMGENRQQFTVHAAARPISSNSATGSSLGRWWLPQLHVERESDDGPGSERAAAGG